MAHAPRTVERPAQLVVRRGVGVIAVNVAQPRGEVREGRLVDPAVLLQALASAGAQLVKAPAGPRHADDRHVKLAAADQRLERREDLLVRQVAGGAEEHERI